MNPTRHKNHKSRTELLVFCLGQQTCILLFALLISNACLSLLVLSKLNWRKISQYIQLCHHGSVISLYGFISACFVTSIASNRFTNH